MTTSSESRVERMARATKDPVVVLHKFNKLRSRHPTKLILVFEGADDPIFYSVIATRSGCKADYLALVADGKDLVLGFRSLIKESTEAMLGDGLAFFIDRDFDDLKGHTPGPDLYCTPTYSIENIACSPQALRAILYNEFKLYDPDCSDDLTNLIDKYTLLINNFTTQIYDLNLLIYFGRTKSTEICDSSILEISDSTTKIFTLDPQTLEVSCAFRGNTTTQLVKFSKPVYLTDANPVLTDFTELDPFTRWRGKFWFALFLRFIAILQEDKNSNNPMFFSKGKGKVRLNMASDSAFRLLASACDIPSCMQSFFTDLPRNALR